MVRTKQRGVPTLGERVTSLMEAAQLNASELSARTGISVSYMTRIIQGEVVNPTIDFVIRIAAGLGVTESELLREDEEDKDARGKEPDGGRSANAVTGAFGAGIGLGAILSRYRKSQQQIDTASQQRDQTIGFLVEVEQIVAEAQLTPEKRILAESLILENARAVCEVLAKEQDQQRR